MQSFRTQLRKIHEVGARAPAQKFWSRPASLRTMMQWMDYPRSWEWRQVQDDHVTSGSWTNLCQGFAVHGSFWIFSSNGSEQHVVIDGKKISFPQVKALYAFRKGGAIDGDHEIAHMVSLGQVGHVGQLVSFEDRIYVSYFDDEISGAIVFELDDAGFHRVEWIKLEPVNNKRVEFQAISPWTRKVYGSYGDLVDRFFIYEIKGGSSVKCMPLSPGIDRSHVKTGGPIQGVCFSDNGHIYISSNHGDGKYQTIFYYSALNGARLGHIDVQARWEPPELDVETILEFVTGFISPPLLQELQGICFDGSRIFTIVLDKQLAGKDNIFFKCFAAKAEHLV